MDFTPKSGWKVLQQLIIQERKEITAIYFYAAMSGFIQLSVPVGIQAIIGFVLGATMVMSIYVLLFVIVLGIFLVGVMQINQMKIIEKVQQKIFAHHAFEFTEVLPRFDLKLTDGLYLPEKVNRFFDTITLQKSFSKLLLDIPLASIQIFLGMLLLSFYHPFFIGFSLLLVIIISALLIITAKQGLKTSIEESTYKYKVVDWLEEMARVIKSFKLSQGTHLNLQKTDQNVLGYLQSRNAHFRVLLIQYRILLAVKVLIALIMLSAGTILLIDQKINIGEFIAAEMVILTIINAVEKLIVNLDSVYDVITGLTKISSVIEMDKEKEGNMNVDSTVNGIDLQLEEVSFSYNRNEMALSNINLHCEPNTVSHISGQEGSGKSTLLRIMTGNYLDFTGKLLVNSIPIQQYRLESYRYHLGYVSRDSDLFKGSILENISLNRPGITQEHVTKLMSTLGFESTFNREPGGLHAMVDSDGRRLPSATIKKILLLRAFANNPKLVLLEEPWQGLEKNDEDMVKQFILKNENKATIIIVTTDQSMAHRCHQSFVMHNGKIERLK